MTQVRSRLETLLLSQHMVTAAELVALGEPFSVEAAVDALVTQELAWRTTDGLMGRRQRIVDTLRTVVRRGPDLIPRVIAATMAGLAVGARGWRVNVQRTEVAAVLQQLVRAGKLDVHGTMVGLPGWWQRRLIWPRLAEIGADRIKNALSVIARTKSLDAAASRTGIPASTLQCIVAHGPKWLEVHHG